MICENCGAKIEDSILVCPYCGSENEAAALREQNRIIKDINGKAKDEEKLKKDIETSVMNKTKKPIQIIAVLIILFVIVNALITYIVSKSSSKKELSKVQNNIAVLESYYQQRDYEEMNTVLKRIDKSWISSYEKYDRAADLYTNTSYFMEDVDFMKSYIEKENIVYTKDDIVRLLRYAASILNRISQYEEKGYSYDEEQICVDMKKNMDSVLFDYFKMNEDEVQQICKLQEQEASDEQYIEIAQKIERELQK